MLAFPLSWYNLLLEMGITANVYVEYIHLMGSSNVYKDSTLHAAYACCQSLHSQMPISTCLHASEDSLMMSLKDRQRAHHIIGMFQDIDMKS